MELVPSPATAPKLSSGRSPLYLAAAFIILVWGIYEAQFLLMPICLAALVTFLMTPSMRFLKRLKMPEPICVILSALLLLLPLAGIVFLVISQIQGLVRDWPSLTASLKTMIVHFQKSSFVQRLHLAERLDFGAMASHVPDNLGAGFKIALESLARVLSAGSELILVVFFSVVMLASRVHIKRSFIHLFSTYSEISWVSSIDHMAELIETFLVARMGIAGGIGVIGLGVMMAFQVPYSFILAVIFGLMTWVPVIGFFLGILPILAVSLAIGKSIAAIAVIFLTLGSVWIVQDHILSPKFIGHKLKLNFLATYLGFFAGGSLWGPWGMFLSVPILGILRIAFDTSPRLEPWAFLMGEEIKKPATPTELHTSTSA